MDHVAHPLDDPAAAAALARYAAALADAVELAIPGWVERVVRQRWREWAGTEPPVDLDRETVAAADAAVAQVAPALRALLATDVDAQRANPLSIIRSAVTHPTSVLATAGVPPARRDADAERIFPEDVYDLSPASFAGVDPSLHEPGLAWGAAKAHVILRRRRAQQRPT